MLARRELWLSLALFTLSLVVLVACDRQYTCPNGGEPKLNKKSGKPIRCLPGERSEKVCGAGHSCYFSGIDYRCCPVAEEAEINESASHGQFECPSDSLTVLSANGMPTRCNPGTRQCPKPEIQFCAERSGVSICCERIGTDQEAARRTNPSASSSPPPPPPMQESVAAMSGSEANKAATPESTSRAPTRLIFIVNSDTGVGSWQQEPKNSQAAMDSRPSMDETKVQSAGQAGHAMTPMAAGNSQSSHGFLADNGRNTQKAHGGKDEKAEDTGGRKQSESMPRIRVQIKAQAAKIESKDAQGRVQPVESRPSIQQGAGDAASKKRELPEGNLLEKLEDPTIQKIFAQQFLVDQIRNGWPYDEKFHGSGRGSTMGKMNEPKIRPSSVFVHFPQE